MQSKTTSLNSAVSELSIADSLLLEEENEHELKTKDMQEESSKGKVHGSLALKYLLAGGNLCLVSTVVLLFFIAQVFASAVDYFVSFWVNIEEFRNVTIINNDTSVVINKAGPNWSTDFCIYIYSALIVLLFVFTLFRSMLFYKLAMWSSKALHNLMFDSIISTTMRFFDTNPSGRILNRFSKDMGSIDEWLPKTILDAAQVSFFFA